MTRQDSLINKAVQFAFDHGYDVQDKEVTYALIGPTKDILVFVDMDDMTFLEIKIDAAGECIELKVENFPAP